MGPEYVLLSSNQQSVFLSTIYDYVLCHVVRGQMDVGFIFFVK